ncbi:MAG: hypothetical protein HYV95_03625 [Opitutae bacterium]|nr:hypothetical protein [Opitutae bacterium]
MSTVKRVERMVIGTLSEGLPLLLVALLATIDSRAAEINLSNRRLLGKIACFNPEPAIVPDGQQMAAAEKLARQIGGLAFFGLGGSMSPLYGDKTALVVRSCSYGQIRRGMTVVYLKQNGFRVAHLVIDEDANGYVVQGLASPEPDPVSVNEDNLIGYVVAAFSSTPRPPSWQSRVQSK